MPPDTMSVTFLGTAAGRPSTTRNVSSLVVKLDSKLCVLAPSPFLPVLCSRGTTRVAR